MNRILLKTALAAAALSSLAACSQPPNPVVFRDPVPQPPPGYKVVCSSHPFIFKFYLADCDPVTVPARREERVIIRAKS